MLSKKILAFAVVLLVVQAGSTALAVAPYYAKGDFNAWGTTDIMTDMGGGHWQGTVAALTPGSQYEYKLADENWTESWPGSNGKIEADGSGTATFHLWLTPPADGWEPSGPRVGYEDMGWGWDIMGDFNGFSSPVAVLSDLGGGLYSANYVVATAATHEFKFRKADDWSISIGDDFGNSAGNAQFTTTVANQPVQFRLDLPNGRWTVVVPEPSTVLLGLSGLIVMAVRRRK